MVAHCSPEDLADYRRDLRKHEPRPRFDQRAAVAKLVGFAEGVAGSGLLPSDLEIMARQIIAETLTAFEMPSKAERESAS